MIWAGVIYLISSFFKGKGTFQRTLEFVGYGYLPQIFGALITFIIALQYIPRVMFPKFPQPQPRIPHLIQEAVKALMHDPAMMEMTQIISIISMVFLLWSANIWIFGMQKCPKAFSTGCSTLCRYSGCRLHSLYGLYHDGDLNEKRTIYYSHSSLPDFQHRDWCR